MALTADQITAQNFKDFYTQILPYLNKGNGGTSDTPLGQVAFFDDTVAPYGWLVADGTVYNIADYPDLANQYERVHGSKNYWGGNGTTTFAVPNWQGEFLRASGTNGHSNTSQGITYREGDGAPVGTHQSSTIIPEFTEQKSSDESEVNIGFFVTPDGQYRTIAYGDRDLKPADTSTIKAYWLAKNQFAERSTSQTYIERTIRPTNTSLLLCIKAVPSSEMNTYSLTERRVGTWIDGKPLYEKTVTIPAFNWGDTKSITHNISNIDKKIAMYGFFYDASYGQLQTLPYIQDNNTAQAVKVQFTDTAVQIYARTTTSSTSGIASGGHITLQYTKTTD